MRRRCAALWRALALCLVWLVADTARAEPRRLSLEEVIRAARQNPLARAALAQQAAAEARAAEAHGARFPQIKLTSFIAPSPKIDCDDPACTTTSPTEIRPHIQGVFGGGRLEVLQPLYTFGKLDAAADAGENAARALGFLARGVQSDLAVEATRAYYGVALARELGRMLQDGAEQIAKGRKTLVERLERGSPDVTVQDRLRLDAFATEIGLRASEAREKEATALAGLRALSGQPDADVAEASLVPLERTLGELDAHIERARGQSPELQAAAHGVTALTRRSDLERANWLPDFGIFGAVTLTRAQGVDDPPSAFADDPFNATTAEVAAVLRWTIEPAMQAARVQRAEAERERGQAQLEAARAGVEFAVRDAHNRAREARARLELAQSGERSARGWVTSVLQADAIGTASARDLADAYLAYFTLHGRSLQSIFDWNVAVTTLERATGELAGAQP